MDSGDFRVLFHLASPTGLPPAEVTFAEQAKSAGYETALIGKYIENTRRVSFDIKFTRQGFENAC